LRVCRVNRSLVRTFAGGSHDSREKSSARISDPADAITEDISTSISLSS
jgi:hypothetical protein